MQKVTIRDVWGTAMTVLGFIVVFGYFVITIQGW